MDTFTSKRIWPQSIARFINFAIKFIPSDYKIITVNPMCSFIIVVFMYI